MSTLFISYSTKDRTTAETVHSKLIEMGFEPPFRDDHPDSGIPAGSNWERELYRRLRLCNAMVILVSRNWLDSKWCFAELAYAKAMGKEFFPVLIDDSPDIPSEVAERQGIRFSDPDVWQRLRRGLVEADLAPDNDFAWPIVGCDDCPYPGLASFETHHAGIYFGRDAEILELRERLNQMADKGDPKLLYIIGASGSGKSSLVKAGLLPRLIRKETTRWCVLPVFRWNDLHVKGRDWAEQLALDVFGAWPSLASRPSWKTLRDRYLIAPFRSNGVKNGEAEVAKRTASITGAADRFIDDTKDLLVARGQPNATPVLVIDQFEELLLAADDDTVLSFFQFLGCVMSSPRSPWRSIATVRTDFLATVQAHEELIAWKHHTDVYSLALMKSDRFYEIIRRPAEKLGMRFESDVLVDQMVKDTGTPDALPLLAFALRELYVRFGSDKQFTFDEYMEQLGGLAGCLKRVADELLVESATSAGVSFKECERTMHLIFSKHLVRINDRDQFVRQVAPWSDLPEKAHPLLLRFIERRLITSRPRDEADHNSERVIEVAHEALFRTWDKLANWLDSRRDVLRWRADVERDRKAEGSRWKGLTPRQLETARNWPQELGDEVLEQEKHWIFTARNKARMRRVALISATVLFGIVAVAAVFFAFEQTRLRKVAEDRLLVTIAKDLVRHARIAQQKGEQDELAALLARQAYIFKQRGGGSTRSEIHEVLNEVLAVPHFSRVVGAFELEDRGGVSMNQGSPDRFMRRIGTFESPFDYEVDAVAFSPSGESIALGRRDSTIWMRKLKPADADPIILRGHDDWVLSLAFDPNERYLASGGKDGTVRLWNLSTPNKACIVLGEHRSEVTSVAFSSDGNTLATGSFDKSVRLWDVDDPSKPARLLQHDMVEITSIAFSPDDLKIACGGLDNAIRIWKLDDLTREPFLLQAHDAWVSSVVFAPDGDTLVSASADKTVRLWDMVNTVAEPTVLSGHTAEVTCVAFSPDGSTIASGAWDKTIRLWRVDHLDEAPTVLKGHKRWIQSLAFSPDGTTIASDGGGRTTRLWDLSTPVSQSTVFASNVEWVRKVAISPDEKTLAYILADSRNIHLVNFFRPNADVTVIDGNATKATSIAFSPDGTRLAIGGDATLQLWSLNDGSSDEPQVVGEWDLHLPEPGVSKVESVLSVTFTPDGKTAFAGSEDGSAGVLWKVDVASPQTPPEIWFRAGESMSSVAVTSDGDRLAAGDHNGFIRVWDLRDRARTRNPIVLPKTSVVTSLAFSPNGRILVSGHWDAVRMWDMNELMANPVVFTGHEHDVNSVAVSPDGKTLASASRDGTVRLWDVANPKLEPIVLREHEVAVSSVAFSPDGKFIASGARDNRIESAKPKKPVLVRIADTEFLANAVCDKVGRNLRIDEWEHFIGNGLPYEPTCPNLPADRSLVAMGRLLALAGDRDAAISAFQRATNLNADLKFNPSVEADLWVTRGRMKNVREHARRGRIEEAINVYNDAKDLNLASEFTVEDLNFLCWFGSLLGRHSDVLLAGEEAVRRAPTKGDVRDTRGVARALSGDFDGAIEDFAFFIRWKRERDGSAADIAARERWIEKLTAGTNPFTPEVRKELLD